MRTLHNLSISLMLISACYLIEAASVEKPDVLADILPPIKVDGVDCESIHKANPALPSGLYNIRVTSLDRTLVQVYCDMETRGGGWTLIQNRFDGSESFYRPYPDYQNGFGRVHKKREFWIGNDVISAMTAATGRHTLRIELEDWDGQSRYAEYDNFKVTSAIDKYRLISLGTYSGDAGDAMTYHLGNQFSTIDQDNDKSATHCSSIFRGGWWYWSCFKCNLNGEYNGTSNAGVSWDSQWHSYSYSLRSVEMKIRSQKN